MIRYSSEIIRHSDKHLVNINSCGELVLNYGNHVIRPNGRSDYQLIYIIEGSCRITKYGEMYTAQKGDVIIYKPNEVQDYLFNGESENHTYYIHFAGEFCKKYFEKLEIDKASIINASQNKDIKQLFYLTCKYFNMSGENERTVCSGLTQSILALISAEMKKKSNVENYNVNTPRINELITRFKMIPDFKMSVSECADFCNLSISHFRRVFKSVTGETPTQFMNRIRVERAKEFLLFTEESIFDISQSCGFDDQNYFSRIFKKAVGLTPSEFRKNK